MSEKFYWGEGGQFGPYSAQEDGWPNAGEVMRDYRERAAMKPEDFATLYSQGLAKLGLPNKKGKLQGKVTGTWILNMEKQNTVPTDIKRRRLIAEILHIPPLLLGLASLESVVMQPRKETDMIPAGVSTSILHRVSTDIANYEKNIRVALHIHRTSSAHGLLKDVNADIESLEGLERQARGDLLYQVRELLLSNDLLATRIVKDQRQHALAYMYANHAVRVAKSMEDGELIATARYMRGCVKAEWGRRGTVKQGIFQLDKEKMQDAVRDFQAVLAYANEGHIHPQLEGFTKLQLSRALGMLRSSEHARKITQALTLADEVAEVVGLEPIDDFYVRALITGTLTGLHLGGYHLGRAETFMAVGLPGKALRELNQVQKLTEKTYRGDETRYQAWFDILMAEALIGLGRFDEATEKARGALIIFHNIDSQRNMATVQDIQSRLAASPYGTSMDVQELGDMLKEWYK
jgi:tetratricopeptide (TPR) repeat protein